MPYFQGISSWEPRVHDLPPIPIDSTSNSKGKRRIILSLRKSILESQNYLKEPY
jgi:hypothetical protein